MMGLPTVDRADRDALVDLLIYRYFADAGLRTMRETKSGVADDLIEVWFHDDLALMADLDWLERWCLAPLGLPESPKAEYEIGLDPDRLRAAVERALADARAAASAGASPLEGSPEDLFDRAAQACEALISEIDRTEESG
jgi:hypothetical protein